MKTSDGEKNLADILFPEDPLGEVEDSILTVPPEQRRLHTETYDFSVSTILEYLRDEKKMFIPEFQRRYVWSDSQASRLIESLIIQCPIPVIYLNQEKDERFSVIDGNQRLTSLNRFTKNIFQLKGLTAYPELDGKYFDDLDPRFQRHILNRTLRCIVILKDTHPQVKFDVFERLNTGSVRLTPQELRHGLYFGPFMTLVAKLAKNKIWLNRLPTGRDKRMRAEEYIIRFFAFHNNSNEYEKPLSGFLNKCAEKYKTADKAELKGLEIFFNKVVLALDEVYGEYAFKIFDNSGRISSGFNAALFDAEMLSISRNLDKAERFCTSDRKRWHKKLAAILIDSEFQKSISRATSDEKMVDYRIDKMVEEFRIF